MRALRWFSLYCPTLTNKETMEIQSLREKKTVLRDEVFL